MWNAPVSWKASELVWANSWCIGRVDYNSGAKSIVFLLQRPQMRNDNTIPGVIHHDCPKRDGYLCGCLSKDEFPRIDLTELRVTYRGELRTYKPVQYGGVSLIVMANRIDGVGSCGQICYQGEVPVGVVVGGYPKALYFQVHSDLSGDIVSPFPLFGKHHANTPKAVRFRGGACVLSNFYPCAIAVDGVNFKSSEHAYQHAKAIFHGDGATAACVVGAKNGAEAKKYGRRTKLRRGGWSEARQDVMRRILQVKFSIPMLSAFLMSTGVAELIENVPSREGYWGLQIDRSAGQNKLGKLLMAIRAEVHGIAPLVHVPVLDVMPRVIPQVHHLCGLVHTPVGFLCPGGQLDKIDRVTTRVEFNGESLLYRSVQCKCAPLIEVTNKSEGPGSCGKVCHQDARPVGVLVGGYKDRIFFQVSGEPFGERVPQFPLFGPAGEESVRRALRAQGLGEIEAMEEVPFTPNGEMYVSPILTVRRGSFWLWALDQLDDLSAALAAEELSDLDSVAAIQRMAKDGVHRDVAVVATLETPILQRLCRVVRLLVAGFAGRRRLHVRCGPVST